MAFQLSSVVPWGRNMEEYIRMFQLNESELSGKIAGFGDGPACFNCEMTERGGSVISFDPIYQFSKTDFFYLTMKREKRRGAMYFMNCQTS